MSSVRIASFGDYVGAANETPDLGPLVKEALGAQVRRVGRYIQLSLIGAARCLKTAPPPQTGVYLTSGRGDMETTHDVMTQLFRDGLTPRPLSFVNTVSNSASFYVAKQMGLHGRSAFVCNRYFSFESTLMLAMLDLEIGAAPAALVGSVDIVLAPLDVHRRRLRLEADTPVAEGSHFVLLEASDAPGPRLASVEVLADASALQAWIAAHASDAAAVAVGQFADAAEAKRIAAQAGVTRVFEYRGERGYYDSQSGGAISTFLSAQPEGVSTLLHVNRDAEGRFAAFAVKA